MKFDLDATIADLDGEPIKDPATQQPMTMRKAVRSALLTPGQDGRPYSQDETLRRFDLAMGSLTADGQVELSAEDVVLVTRAVMSVFAPLVAGTIARTLGKPVAE